MIANKIKISEIDRIFSAKESQDILDAQEYEGCIGMFSDSDFDITRPDLRELKIANSDGFSNDLYDRYDYFATLKFNVEV